MPQLDSPSTEQQFINVRGRSIPYLERWRIRQRHYYLLERIGSPRRERYKAFDPLAGPDGDFFQVQYWPPGPTADQNLRLIRRLKDDSFPRVVQFERLNDGHLLALTWVEGITLAQYLHNVRAARRPPVDPGEAVRLIRGLANAVCKLNAHLRICHSDIQPANVVITQHPSRLALIDFGSARTHEAALAAHPGDGAQPCYSAPELATRAYSSPFHADQFSVSVLFYELLTQQLPYQGLGGKTGRPEFKAGAAQSLIPPSEASELCRGLPHQIRQHLDQTLLRGLALKPEDRFPDRHGWLNELFALHAHLRIVPQSSACEYWLTQVIEYFVKPKVQAERK